MNIEKLKWWQLLLILIIGFPVFGGVFSLEGNSHFSEVAGEPEQSPYGEIELSMLTINIYHDREDWPARFPLLLREIKKLNPDIIALQEVIQRKELDNQAGMIADSLGYDYHFVSVDDESSDKRYGNAILSRYPIKERQGKNLKPYDDYRTAAHVSVEAGGGMIDIYNTHLHHLEENREIRKEQISCLLDFIDETSGGGPVFLMGDFNANPDWDEIALLKKEFRDVYPVFYDNHLDSVHSTLNYHMGHDKRRIDHIYFNRPQSQKIIPRKAEIVLNEEGKDGVFPSDHFGVYAEFGITIVR